VSGPTPRPVPVTDDRDTGGYFEAAARGELVVRACSSCGRTLHLPRAYCSSCGSWAGEWREVAPRGTLYSWTVAAHAVHPAFPAPYTIVLVALDDAPGARLVGYLPGTPELAAGQPMEAWFETLGDGTVLPQWRPV
jgi:uncharacterized protein